MHILLLCVKNRPLLIERGKYKTFVIFSSQFDFSSLKGKVVLVENTASL